VATFHRHGAFLACGAATQAGNPHPPWADILDDGYQSLDEVIDRPDSCLMKIFINLFASLVN